MGGRPPKPIAELKQQGTYRKDRHADRGTTLGTIKTLPTPEDISDLAKKRWEEIVPELCKADLVTEADGDLLAYAFRCFGLAKDLQSISDSFEGGPAYYIASLDKMKKDVEFESLRYMQEYKNIMYKFGVSPVERARIRGNAKPKEEDQDSAIKDIIGNG